MRCDDCKFWLKFETESAKDGQCRRMPPQNVGESTWKQSEYVYIIEAETLWPVTTCDDWCGEFKTKAAE